jgi:2-iminoacetate synthase
MLEGGIPFVGMGVLSGLASWRNDWAMLMQHEAYLQERFPSAGRILGLPRLKPAAGAEIGTSIHLPSDSEFCSAAALHSMFAPRVIPFVSTRERWDLCTKLASGGGCLFTFDCSTIPGGYSLGKSGNQFQTGSYDPAMYLEPLAASGLHARFDWDFCLSSPERARDTLAVAG